jgi:hypothetical protein
MMSQRLACPPAPGPLEAYAATFDGLFGTLAQRRSFREYLQSNCLGCQEAATGPQSVGWIV